MMEMVSNSIGWFDWLLVWLSLGVPGVPQGTADPALLSSVPADAIVAAAWAGQRDATPDRGAVPADLASNGPLGAFVTDPEIRRAAAALEKWHTAPSQTARQRQIATMAKTFLAHPGVAYARWAPAGNGAAAGWQVVIVARVGTSADEARNQLRSAIPQGFLTDARTAGSTGNLLVKFYEQDGDFVWTIGRTAATDVLTTLKHPNGGVTVDPLFQRSVAAVGIASPGSLLWVNLAGVLAAQGPIDQLIGPKWSQWRTALPTTTAPRLLAMTAVVEGRVVSRAAFLAGNEAVAPNLTTIDPQALRFVPADAHVVAALGGDLSLITAPLRSLLAKLDAKWPTIADDVRGRIERELGMDLSADVLPAFGSTWSVYSAPSTGGAMGLSPVFSVSVVNPRLAYSVFTQAMHILQRRLPDETPPRMVFSSDLYDDRMLYTLTIADGPGRGLAPTFCVTDTQMLVTLNPQTMRSHLRFVSSGMPSFAQRAEAAGAVGSAAWTWVDNRAIAAGAWPLVTHLAHGRLNTPEFRALGIDGGTLPSLGAILMGLADTTATIRAIPGGVLCEARHPLSLAGSLGSLAAIVGLSAHSDASPGLRATPAIPSNPLGIDLGTPAEVTSTPDLKTPSGIVPAVATDAPAAKPSAPVANRQWISGLLRSVTPDDVEMLIPAEVIKRLEEGPTPEELQRRAERRAALEQKRLQRRGRLPAAPAPVKP